VSGGDEGLNTSVDSSTVTVGLLVIESLIAELTNSVPALRGDFLVSALLALDPNGSFNWDIRRESNTLTSRGDGKPPQRGRRRDA